MLFCRDFGQKVHLSDVMVRLLGGFKRDVIVSRNLHCGIAAWRAGLGGVLKGLIGFR
jgi:hypothetical protein